MSNLYRIISKIQKELSCPVCGQHYEIAKIKVKGLVDHTVMIQTVCDNKHLTLFMTQYHANSENERPITNKDIFDLRQKLAKFEGNLETFWN